MVARKIGTIALESFVEAASWLEKYAKLTDAERRIINEKLFNQEPVTDADRERWSKGLPDDKDTGGALQRKLRAISVEPNKENLYQDNLYELYQVSDPRLTDEQLKQELKYFNDRQWLSQAKSVRQDFADVPEAEMVLSDGFRRAGLNVLSHVVDDYRRTMSESFDEGKGSLASNIFDVTIHRLFVAGEIYPIVKELYEELNIPKEKIVQLLHDASELQEYYTTNQADLNDRDKMMMKERFRPLFAKRLENFIKTLATYMLAESGSKPAEKDFRNVNIDKWYLRQSDRLDKIREILNVPQIPDQKTDPDKTAVSGHGRSMSSLPNQSRTVVQPLNKDNVSDDNIGEDKTISVLDRTQPAILRAKIPSSPEKLKNESEDVLRTLDPDEATNPNIKKPVK